LLPLFLLSIDTGLRASEVRSLRFVDFTLVWEGDRITGGELVVPKSKTEAGRGRLIPLTRRICDVLTDWFARFPSREATHYVFPKHQVGVRSEKCPDGMYSVEPSEPVREWKTSWYAALGKANLDYRWHDLRHTFISRLAENPNVSEETIRSLAGHVSREMLQRYSHIRKQAKVDAIIHLEMRAEHGS
jgi:integrase